MKQEKLNYSNLTTLPNNFLAEQAILNILLTNSSLIKNKISNLKLNSFYYEPHKLIYEVIIELSEKNNAINLTTVITKLQSKGYLTKIGGIEKIINIINRFESFSDLDDYIKLVNEKYLRRLLIDFGKQLILWGYTTSIEIEELLMKTEQYIFSLNQQKLSQNIYTSAEVIDDVFTELKLKINDAKFNNSPK
jgi:replicative DNA helicase